MGTTAAAFYLSTVTQDQALSGAGVIRGLAETVPAADSTTTLTWTATGVQTRTVVPFTGSTASSDTSQNNGWAFGNASGSAGSYLESTGSAQRQVPAGTWTFSGSVTLNAPALLATVSATVTAKVYRVAAGGGARTLLVTATSAAVTNNGVAAATVAWTATATGQPLVLLGAGETLEVGYTIASQATANALGTVTNTVVTFLVGATGSAGLTVPDPGVRTQYNRSPSDTTSTSDALARVASFPRAESDATSTSDALARRVTTSRALAESTVTSDGLARAVTFPRSSAETTSTSDSAARTVQFNRQLAETVTSSDVLVRRVTTARAVSEATSTSDSVARQITYGRSWAEYPPGANPDFPVTFPTRRVAGYVRNGDGTVYTGGATVLLVRDSDRKVVQTQTSAADGSYSFPRDTYDPNTYYVEARETATSPAQQGSTPSGLTPA